MMMNESLIYKRCDLWKSNVRREGCLNPGVCWPTCTWLPVIPLQHPDEFSNSGVNGKPRQRSGWVRPAQHVTCHPACLSPPSSLQSPSSFYPAAESQMSSSWWEMTSCLNACGHAKCSDLLMLRSGFKLNRAACDSRKKQARCEGDNEQVLCLHSSQTEYIIQQKCQNNYFFWRLITSSWIYSIWWVLHSAMKYCEDKVDFYVLLFQIFKACL